jgi:hypothetical protein
LVYFVPKGFYQEGEGAAVFLNEKDGMQGATVLQFVRDTAEGRALSRGFLDAWHGFGQKAQKTLVLKKGETVTAEFLQKAFAPEKPAALVLWDGFETHKALGLLAAGKDRPSMVLVSSSFLGQSMFSLDEKLRAFTFLTYPYGISQRQGEKNPATMSGVKKFNPESNAVATTRISQRMYLLTLILDMALTEMRGDYYRDNLLDAIGMITDQGVQLYDHVSFGAGQRYVSKGCYVVQLTEAGLVKRSAWLLR